MQNRIRAFPAFKEQDDFFFNFSFVQSAKQTENILFVLNIVYISHSGNEKTSSLSRKQLTVEQQMRRMEIKMRHAQLSFSFKNH